MEPHVVSHIVCSSLFLACMFAQLLWLARAAHRFEHASREAKKDNNKIRPPTWMRRLKQTLPVITAFSGLAHCACNIALRSEGSQHAEYWTNLLLGCVVFLGESTIAAELAYLTWSVYNGWTIRAGACMLVATNISSFILRALVGRSALHDALARWVPPALSTIVEGTLGVGQAVAVCRVTHSAIDAASITSRQWSLVFYWISTLLPGGTVGRLALQHSQALVLIHSPRDWPVAWMQRRKERQKTAASEGSNRYQQRLPGAHWEESESSRKLVSAHLEEA